MVNMMPFVGGHQWAQGGGGGGGMNQIGLGIAIAASMVVLSTFQRFLFSHFGGYLERIIRRLVSSMDPYVQIKFPEDSVDGSCGPKNREAYDAIETYLSATCSAQAPRLKANSVRDIKFPVLCVDEGEDVSDEFNGVRIWWRLGREKDPSDSYRGSRTSKYFALTFRKMNKKLVVEEYLRHVMEVGKAVAARNRQLKLYSNGSSEKGSWNCIMNFDHPATFETVAMEREKKRDIIDDLIRFSNGREYYRRIGKPWKRGYLLYGPPGTGKSTMIAAMANLLSYDVYDLELTAVSSNAALKRLLHRTPCNSILVIEDIDCTSNNVTAQREEKKKGVVEDDQKPGKTIERVTLSGLLNSVDGLFSANEGGRLMVFTTNHVEALDSALVRRGRMDKHIEMSFCGFEAFTVLARNYLGVDEHELFPKIQGLLRESEITPADVAENLIATSGGGEGSAAVACLEKLIRVLEKKKVEEENGGK